MNGDITISLYRYILYNFKRNDFCSICSKKKKQSLARILLNLFNLLLKTHITETPKGFFNLLEALQLLFCVLSTFKRNTITNCCLRKLLLFYNSIDAFGQSTVPVFYKGLDSNNTWFLISFLSFLNPIHSLCTNSFQISRYCSAQWQLCNSGRHYIWMNLTITSVIGLQNIDDITVN